MIRKELEKKLKVLEKTLDQIDAMKLEIKDDPATAPVFGGVVSELDKVRKRVVRDTRKKLSDDDMLRGLVLLIEILDVPQAGMPKELVYERVSSGDYSKSRVKKLWNDTRTDNPEKIEELRKQIAFSFVSQFIEWKVSSPTRVFPAEFIVAHFQKRRPALWRWAWKTAVKDRLGEKYEEPDEALEANTIALMREIASAD
jgi:hypothetical protein